MTDPSGTMLRVTAAPAVAQPGYTVLGWRVHDIVATMAGLSARGVEYRKKFLALLRDPAAITIVVEHRDRFARFGAEYVEAALAAQGRRLLVVDSSEVDDDLVRDVTEILTSLCARLYGRRAAANRARRAVEVATEDPV
jgi:predicted site-specific integrase-resolvase